MEEEMASLFFVRVSFQDHGVFWNISKCLIALFDALKGVLFFDSELSLLDTSEESSCNTLDKNPACSYQNTFFFGSEWCHVMCPTGKD